jgi:protein SCO1
VSAFRYPLAVLAAVFSVAVLVGYWIIRPPHVLPVLQPSELNPALVDRAVRAHENHTTLPWRLVNQLGDTVSHTDVVDQIIVADFFFTRCATICPILTQQLRRVQDAYPNEPALRILSHSVTPVMDSVSCLANYATRFGANPDRWWFLTGQKSDIYNLARKSYFACLDEGDGGLQDFVHTENIVLIDRARRIRGVYDGTDESAMDQLIVDVQWLLDSGE